MTRVLLTGATGQIGRWVLHELAGRPDIELTLALRDPVRQCSELAAWLAGHGVVPARPLQALAFDLDRPQGAAALVQAARPDVVVHLAARFAWGLAPADAQRANVQTSVALLRALAGSCTSQDAVHDVANQAESVDAATGDADRAGHADHADHADTRSAGAAVPWQGGAPARFIHVSGFMLQHHAHLRRLGIGEDGQARGPGGWAAVYRRAGGYEASKLHAHAEMTRTARELGQPLVVLHPATVAGHSGHCELPGHAALHQLCRQLARGRLGAIPGGAAYRLPLVAVDFVARFIAGVVRDAAVQGGQYLLMDAASPPAPQLVRHLADALGRPAPRRTLPIGLLRLPGVAALSGTHPESLDFLVRDVAFDTAAADRLAARWGLAHPPLEQVLRQTAGYVGHQGACAEPGQRQGDTAGGPDLSTGPT